MDDGLVVGFSVSPYALLMPAAVAEMHAASPEPLGMFLSFAGFGVIAQGATVNMMLQSMVDEDKRGRVMAIYTAMFIGAVPLGSFVLGWLGERIGTTHTMLWGAAACVIGAIGLFRAGAPS